MNKELDLEFKQMVKRNLNTYNTSRMEKIQFKSSIARTRPFLLKSRKNILSSFMFTWLKPFKDMALNSRKQSKALFKPYFLEIELIKDLSNQKGKAQKERSSQQDSIKKVKFPIASDFLFSRKMENRIFAKRNLN